MSTHSHSLGYTRARTRAHITITRRPPPTPELLAHYGKCDVKSWNRNPYLRVAWHSKVNADSRAQVQQTWIQITNVHVILADNLETEFNLNCSLQLTGSPNYSDYLICVSFLLTFHRHLIYQQILFYLISLCPLTFK